MDRDNLPVIDQRTLVEVGRATGGAVLARIIATFIDELASRRHALARAMDPVDPAGIKQVAHAIKSSAGTFGARRLEHAATVAEGVCLGEGQTTDGAPLPALSIGEAAARLEAAIEETSASYRMLDSKTYEP